MKDKLENGMYYRSVCGNIKKLVDEDLKFEMTKQNCELASFDIIDLIEYMDLLVIENKVKDIDNKELYVFNPVRCDGFTTFENGKRCMIINMDYIVPIENITIKSILTKEQFERMSYYIQDVSNSEN